MSETAMVVQPQAGIVRASGDVVEALREYQKMQQGLDEAMPDAIIAIQGRQFRRKQYWRAVATGFNLDCRMVSEQRTTDGDDWGYVVTYRATAPNGRQADGDGACYASEKRGRGQATVHNVRSHAHTRAFNRAVSNLVGFGEVSAEEAEKDEHPAEPGSYDGPPPQKPAASQPANNVWQGKVTVNEQKGTSKKSGKPYTKFILSGDDGTVFSTFDRKHADFIRNEAGSSPIVITFSRSAYGLEAEFVGPAE